MRRLLSIPARLYEIIVTARTNAYRLGLFTTHHLPVPVVSIGNITVGGTGKTPLTIAVSKKIIKLGVTPAILSRGYKGTFTGEYGFVADRAGIQLSANQAGDEPYMMAKRLPGTTITIGGNRVVSGRATIDYYHPDCLILDDGFQHLRLHRDLNLLLLDASRSLQTEYLLPRGRLREPISALQRADLIVLSHCEDPEQTYRATTSLRAFGVKGELVLGRHIPSVIRSLDGAIELPLSWLQAQPVCAFCGIAKPEAFSTLITSQGGVIKAFHTFPDHHRFTKRDYDALNRLASDTCCRAMLTTEKDAVRLDPRALRIPVYYLAITFGFIHNEEVLDRVLEQTLDRITPKP